jgi:hypothetical protein
MFSPEVVFAFLCFFPPWFCEFLFFSIYICIHLVLHFYDPPPNFPNHDDTDTDNLILTRRARTGHICPRACTKDKVLFRLL